MRFLRLASSLFSSLLALPLLCAVGACTDSKGTESIIDKSPDKKIEGMIAVRSAGKSVKLESLKAKFDYDFMLGEHEVTCGEIVELSDDAWGGFAKCKGNDKNLPIGNVSYYDAVYFANAKSREMGDDSVYSYTKADFDENGHCVGLEGLKVNDDVDGFRLPTEAEWVLVASTYWNVAESWNSDNSDYEMHEVCSKRKGSSGFCDLAGNVAEWTNDWLGNLKDTTVTNFAGAPNGGAIEERVVKGGSYRNDADALSYTSRGDVYTVTSSTRKEYIGFRLAYGKIPDVVRVAGDVAYEEASAKVLVSTQALYEKTGSYRNKIAFRNHNTGNLAYVDFFSSGALTAVEIHDTINSFHPDISPDGSKVAFCTVMEGNDKTSKLYVRNLDASGSGLVKLDVESAAIPRWYVTAGGDTVIVYVSSAADNSDDAAFVTQSTWQVPFAKGKFGTPQKLFGGAYHGGVSASGASNASNASNASGASNASYSLAVTGSTKLRARVSATAPSAKSDATNGGASPKTDASSDKLDDASFIDTIWYNGEQACNASLSKDGTNRTLFLDFASATGREFVGTKYTVHGRMFIADSTGKLIQSVASPKGYTFDHTEWAVGATSPATGAAQSNPPVTPNTLVISTLTNSDGAHTKIALIDVSDSSVTELIKDEELWHPCLWAGTPRASLNTNAALGGGNLGGNLGGNQGGNQDSNPGTLNLDSAGVYLAENHDNYASIVRVKMELFWKNIANSRVVVVGSSRARTGIDPDLFPELKMLNMAFIGVDGNRELNIVENYVLNHADSLKAVVLSLDLDGWRGNVDFWSPVASRYPGYIYDANHNYWADGIPENFVAAVESAYPAEQSLVRDFTTRGGLLLDTHGWDFEPVQVYYDSTFSAVEQDAFDSYMDRLMKLADIAAKKKVYLIGVIFPQAPQYKKTGSLGLYGMQRSMAKKKIAWLDSKAKEKPYFVLMDENKMGDHDYADSLSYNMDHLSSAGAKVLTTRLAALLKTLE